MLELIDMHVQPATAEKPILSGINLQASRGQPLLISGASGSGKTTLLEVISGLSRPQRGSICWQGEPLTARQRRWITGVLFQFPERHFLGLNVSQELKLGHRRLSSDEQNRVLDQVGLRGVDGRQAPERLSGGQQRRLALAVQLLRQPEVLLLDEPTAGLDWSVRTEVLELLLELSRERVMLVVTHEPALFAPWQCPHCRLQEGKLRTLSPLAPAES